MSSSIPLQLAETIQTAHINRHPSPAHDANPSTAASEAVPVEPLSDKRHDDNVAVEPHHYHPHDDIIHRLVVADSSEAEDEDEEEGDDDGDEDDSPYSVVRPKRRHSHLPPLPDLRFEQSYLHSISRADTWWKVVWVTVRDQVMMPFIQGIIYNLAICGWQYWNRNARMSGNTLGARLRRWWYGVNNWPIPPQRLKPLSKRG